MSPGEAREYGLIDRVLEGPVSNGGKPADFPVEQPTKFEVIVNARTAKSLGLTIPQSVLLRVDQVIE